MNKPQPHKRYTEAEIIEAKNYYFDDAMKMANNNHSDLARDFLINFDRYRDECMAAPKRRGKADNMEMWLRHNLNRVEGMLERYFKLKEMGRL